MRKWPVLKYHSYRLQGYRGIHVEVKYLTGLHKGIGTSSNDLRLRHNPHRSSGYFARVDFFAFFVSAEGPGFFAMAFLFFPTPNLLSVDPSFGPFSTTFSVSSP